MPEYVYETYELAKDQRKDIEDLKSALLSNYSDYNQAFENLMILHNALAENISQTHKDD